MSKKTILLAGGGTAGHVNPLIATAQQLLMLDPSLEIKAFGTKEGLEAELLPANNIEMISIPKVPLPRKIGGDLFKVPSRLNSAVSVARKAIQESRASAVVGFGGYVSMPVYLAARKEKVPVFIHEQNAKPGLANKVASRWAAGVATTFPGTKLKNAVCLGLPLRENLLQAVVSTTQDAKASKAAAAARLGIANLPTILVTGGSSGAQKINEVVVSGLPSLLALGFQVLHLTGKAKAEQALAAKEQLPSDLRDSYHVREYLMGMEDALIVSDLVVCRSGAGTVWELAAFGKPAIFIPLAIGNGEQELNAQPFLDAGAASVIKNGELTAEVLISELRKYLLDEKNLATATSAAANLASLDAGKRLATIIMEGIG